MSKKNAATVTVEKQGNQYLLRLDSDPTKTLSWPKRLRPDNPDDFVGKKLSVTHSGASVEWVRCEDPAWEPVEPKEDDDPRGGHRDRDSSRQHSRDAAKEGSARPSRKASDDFINPYNFVPFAGDPSDNPDGLAPALPPGHDRFVRGAHTGVLEISLKTVTPLLLVDQSRAEVVDGHKTLPCRIDQEGMPQLPASALRGMLRSAFEAVTNSAFGVFDRRWENPLAMRNPAQSALNMRLARVSSDGLDLELQTDLQPANPGWHTAPGNLMPDPWIPLEGRASRYRHLSEHEIDLELWYHAPKGRQGGFYFWRDAAGGVKEGRSKRCQVNGQPVIRKVRGLAFSTGKTIGMKHDDRLFVTHVGKEEVHFVTVPISSELRRSWEGVIDSYAAAAKERKTPVEDLPPYVRDHDDWVKLSPGTLCFATVESSGGKTEVTRITPAMISRTPFSVSPAELTQGHLPPERLTDLTPAERVFGWVNGDASYAGQLRIEPPKCQTEHWQGRDAAANPLELATLAGPKPAYYRFYVEGDDPKEKAPERGFVKGGSLRGWKTYVHHESLPKDFESYVRVRTYVEHPKPNSRDAGRAPQTQPSCKVTLSVRQWVKPEVEFTTKIWVKNLNDAEFGALLWLLDEGRFRLGLGKPLGFGTVATDVTGWTSLNPGHRYLNHDATPDSTEELRANFERLWNGRASHLDAYRQAMQGWSDVPVEYPHVQAPSGYRPQGQPGYLWFVENERANDRKSLPPIGGKAPTMPWYQHNEDDLGRVEEVRRTRPCTTPSRGGRQGQASRRPAAKGKPAAKAAPAGERRSGRVKTYFRDRGFGFIQGDDGQEYFVRKQEVNGGSLAANQRVTFDVGRGKEGKSPPAVNVTVTEVRS